VAVAPSGLARFLGMIQGRHARYASHLPLATLFRAFGARRPCFLGAPSALDAPASLAHLRRSAQLLPFARAFGATFCPRAFGARRPCFLGAPPALGAIATFSPRAFSALVCKKTRSLPNSGPT
jgi:hypothetical protein